MRVEKDYEDLLESLNKYKVRYCIVGAFAVAYHAVPRYTKDMDILVDPSAQNAEKLVLALGDFGFGSMGLSKSDFTRKGQIIQLGVEPIRVDLLTSLKGLSFDEIWQAKKRGAYGRQRVYFIGLQHLIKAKKVANRRQDLVDLEVLKTKKG